MKPYFGYRRETTTVRPYCWILVVTFLASTSMQAADWNSCADDLDRLRRASRDAADSAEQVKSKYDEIENCRRFPDIYDLMRDRCRSKVSDYQSALNSLQSELSTVDSRIRSARSSCGYDLATLESPSLVAPGAAPSGVPRICSVIQGYRGQIPDGQLLQICIKSASESECRKCFVAR